MKVLKNELEALLELQGLIVHNRKLELEAKTITSGGAIDELRDQMLALSGALNQKRTGHEELMREQKRSETELEMVAKRTKLDQERLSKTAVPRDAISIQHELETLANRRSTLEEVALGVMERIEASNREQHELNLQRDKLEQELEEAKEIAKVELASLKKVHSANAERISTLKAVVSQELLAIFEKKFARGTAIGKLTKNNCGACNMNLNATTMAQISHISLDELAACPECQAILIR